MAKFTMKWCFWDDPFTITAHSSSFLSIVRYFCTFFSGSFEPSKSGLEFQVFLASMSASVEPRPELSQL